MPLRAKVASSVSRTAAALSRAAGRGDGSVIGGWIGLKIDPDLLAHLAAGRADRAGLRHQRQDHHHPAHRRRARRARRRWPPTRSAPTCRPGTPRRWPRPAPRRTRCWRSTSTTSPRCIDATTPARGRAAQPLPRPARPGQGGGDDGAAVARRRWPPHPDVHVVANADDPMVVWAAPAPRDGHLVQRRPALARRLLGLPRVRLAHRARPSGDWWLHRLRAAPPACRSGRSRTTAWSTRAGGWHQVKLQLPGRVNLGNAATALAVAAQFGVARPRRSPRLAAGHLGRRPLRPGRARRPRRSGCCWRRTRRAGWRRSTWPSEAPTLLSINARDPDGLDTSWLFDVDFSPLRGRQVLITGDRAYDLAVRLEVNDVPFRHVRTFAEAVAAVPPGRLEVIANYTAFQDIRAELDRVN